MTFRLPNLPLILLAVAALALLAVFALAPASVSLSGVALAQTADPPADTEPTSAGICGRTPQVRDAILNRLSDVSQCADVTGDHLASIDGELHLEEKDITSLRAGDFDGLTELRVLLLWYNRIEELPPGIFDQLTALEQLQLESMELGELPPGVFDQLTALKKLNLNYNRLGELPDGIFDKLTALKLLNLGNNRLSELPDGIFDKLTALENLELWINRIEELPPDIFDQLTVLKSLAVGNNRLGELPDGIFDQLTALEYLGLWDNRIEELPPGVFDQLIALKSLGLSGNRLGELPLGVFDQLTALERLRLSSMGLGELPPGVFDKLTALKLLDLGSNQLGELPDGIFDQLTALERLNLWGNQIEELPPGIFDQLTALKSLDLGYNRLGELPDGIFDRLTALERLFLNDNRLTTLPTPLLPSTAQGTPITRMMLYGNALAELPDRLFESDYSDYRALHLNDNPGTPFAFIIEGEVVGPSVQEGDDLTAKVRYRVAQGAPVEMRARLSVTGGTASTSTVTIPAGRVHSEEITVTKSAESDSVTLTLDDVSAHISSGDPVELYQVYRNYAGESDFENEFSGIRFVAGAPFTVLVPPAPPDKPTAMVINPGAVELDWNDTFNTQSYGVGVLSDGSWVELPDGDVQVAFRESGAVVTGLPDHPVYVFAVRAKNRDGASGWSQHVSVASGQPATATPTQEATTTTTLPAPNTPTATLTPQDTVALDWQDVVDADSYAVRFVLDDQWVELPSDGVAVAVTGSSAVVSNLPDYDHYYFAVRAGKGDEKSGWSDWVKVSRPRPAPAPTPPPTVTVTCHFDLGTLATTAEPLSVEGSWILECPAEGRIWSRTGIWYPRFYTFTLDRAYRVDIDLHSEDNTFLRLRTGRQTSGATVDENAGSSSSSDARIVRTLTAQTYTIEATTWPREERGDFTLSIQLSDVNAPAQQQQQEPPSADATLSGLALSRATLAFASTTTEYTVSVANDVTQTTVTPALSDDEASYAFKLDGVADADGVIPLAVGSNVITIEVTAEDGKTAKTYTVTVTRAEQPASGPGVSIGLSPSGSVEPGTAITATMTFGGLESDSDTSTTDYTFRADVVNADACEGGGMGNDRYMYKVDEDPEVRTGSISTSCAPGDYTVEVSISSPGNAELASATADFTVNAPAQQQQQEPPSTDATLSNLALSNVDFGVFTSSATEYAASVANYVTQTAVTPTVNNDGATYAIKLGGVTDADGVIPLAVGSNVITIEVTAEDGNTAKTYKVTVSRAAPPLSTDATLSSLALNGVPFTFASDTTSYDVNVANGVDKTTVTATANDDGATYAIKLGDAVDEDGTVELSVGSNAVSVVVTAEDGKTTKTYTVTVTRADPPPPEPVEPEPESTTERSAWLESNPENKPFVGEWQHFTLRGSGLDKVDLSVNVIGFGGAPSSMGAVGYATASPPGAVGEVCGSAYYSGYQMSVDATFSLVGCREGTVIIELLDPGNDWALLKRYTVTVNAGP